eukprot:TRINITY_DN25837_c0_g1_i1.p1 TRINITY_DN25837_c0_g1~~TRINITY_DN25837_c0_g1_i1.p1  ORF type:complete len:542 (+),score=42.09 TRINITY_DN25837_c0_g1_i1:55-1680(+)
MPPVVLARGGQGTIVVSADLRGWSFLEEPEDNGDRAEETNLNVGVEGVLRKVFDNLCGAACKEPSDPARPSEYVMSWSLYCKFLRKVVCNNALPLHTAAELIPKEYLGAELSFSGFKLLTSLLLNRRLEGVSLTMLDYSRLNRYLESRRDEMLSAAFTAEVAQRNRAMELVCSPRVLDFVKDYNDQLILLYQGFWYERNATTNPKDLMNRRSNVGMHSADLINIFATFNLPIDPQTIQGLLATYPLLIQGDRSTILFQGLIDCLSVVALASMDHRDGYLASILRVFENMGITDTTGAKLSAKLRKSGPPTLPRPKPPAHRTRENTVVACDESDIVRLYAAYAEVGGLAVGGLVKMMGDGKVVRVALDELGGCGGKRKVGAECVKRACPDVIRGLAEFSQAVGKVGGLVSPPMSPDALLLHLIRTARRTPPSLGGVLQLCPDALLLLDLALPSIDTLYQTTNGDLPALSSFLRTRNLLPSKITSSTLNKAYTISHALFLSSPHAFTDLLIRIAHHIHYKNPRLPTIRDKLLIFFADIRFYGF